MQFDINIALFNERDPDTFNKVFDKFFPRLYNFAQQLLDDDSEAMDVAQESFIKLYKQAEPFENFENIKAFLFVTARNNCFDILRRKKLRKSWAYLIAEENCVEHPAIERDWMEAEIISAIEKLPPRQRRIIKLYFLEGKLIKEIASELNVSKETVIIEKARAIIFLRQKITNILLAIIVTLLSLVCATCFSKKTSKIITLLPLPIRVYTGEL